MLPSNINKFHHGGSSFYRLFHVHAGASGKSRAVEVSAESSKLNSNDSFVLVTPTSSYLWIGKGDIILLMMIKVHSPA